MRAPDERLTPRLWNCHSKADQDRLEKSTIETIEAEERKREAEERELDRQMIENADPEEEMWLEEQIHQNWPGIARAAKLPTRTELHRQYILDAIRLKDEKYLCMLLRWYPELVPFAVSALLNPKRKPGRAKGDPRPSDLPDGAKDALREADHYVGRIRDIWWRYLGKRYRSASPTAIEIAARRFGVTPEQLANYRKNKRRRI